MSSFNILAQVSGSYTQVANSGLSGSQKVWNFTRSNGTITLDDGVASNQADRMYATPDGGQTITTGTNFDIDLSGTVPDAVGQNTVFVKVKSVKIYAYTTNTGNVTYGNATNPFQGWLGAAANTSTIPPGGVLMHTHPTTGWTVTAGTGDIMRINNATGADAKVDIEIIGTSA